MKKYVVSSVFVVMIMLFSSCSNSIYFTKEMRYALYDSKVPIGDVQFYNSRTIVLRRNLSYAETKVARGEIKFENGQYVEEIIIPKNTPGVEVEQGKNYLSVAFENGRNRDLKFVQNQNNYYQLTPDRRNGEYSKVVYDTLIYILEPGSDRVLLKVKKDNIYNFEKKKRVVKGISVGQP